MILWTEKVRAWIAFNLILLCFILLMIHHGCDSFSTSPIKEWFSLGKIFCFRKPDFLSFNLKLILKFSSSSGVVSFDLSALCKHSFTRTFAAFINQPWSSEIEGSWLDVRIRFRWIFRPIWTFLGLRFLQISYDVDFEISRTFH